MPLFGCRAYKLLNYKPGKFEARAAKGWLLGFQQNTSNNFIIYYPQHTYFQGWRWILSFTPNSTFNEDIVFGDKTELTCQKLTSSYSCDSIFTNQTIPSPIRENQCTSQSERDYQSPLSEVTTTNLFPPKSIIAEPPPIESITFEPSSSDGDITTTRSPSLENMIIDPLSFIVTPNHPSPTENTALIRKETRRSPMSSTPNCKL